MTEQIQNKSQDSQTKARPDMKKNIIGGIIGGLISAVCVYFVMHALNGSSKPSAEQFYSMVEKNLSKLGSRLPMQVDEFTSLQKISFDRKSSNVVYIYSLENKKKPIAEELAQAAKENKDVVRKTTVKQACGNKSVKQMLELEASDARIKALHYVYNYNGSQLFDFTVTLEDCKK